MCVCTEYTEARCWPLLNLSPLHFSLISSLTVPGIQHCGLTDQQIQEIYSLHLRDPRQMPSCPARSCFNLFTLILEIKLTLSCSSDRHLTDWDISPDLSCPKIFRSYALPVKKPLKKIHPILKHNLFNWCLWKLVRLFRICPIFKILLCHFKTQIITTLA